MIILNLIPALLLALSSGRGAFPQSSTPREELPFGTEDNAAEPVAEADSSPTGPTYLSLAANINDFGLFADGGPDSNWFVGFNNAWVVKLPPAPTGFQRAFIGAKIGRAKSLPKADKPWEYSVLPGKIYMAISPVPSFPSERSFFLVETEDIPLENSDKVYRSGTGPSQWFWAEVPLKLVSTSRPNYLIIWSPAREFRDAEHSPILAALGASPTDASEESLAWNNHSIQGVPPRSENDALQVPIKIRPALALKLVPPASRKVVVSNFSGRLSGEEILAQFSVQGTDVESAWIELSQDELEWHRISRYLRQPPFAVTIPRGMIPSRGGYLRARARDTMAAEGSSKTLLITTHGLR